MTIHKTSREHLKNIRLNHHYFQSSSAFSPEVLIYRIAPKAVCCISVDNIQLLLYANYHLKPKWKSCQSISCLYLLKSLVGSLVVDFLKGRYRELLERQMVYLKSFALYSWYHQSWQGLRGHRLKTTTWKEDCPFFVSWRGTDFFHRPGSVWNWSWELDAVSLSVWPKTFISGWLLLKTSRQMQQTPDHRHLRRILVRHQQNSKTCRSIRAWPTQFHGLTLDSPANIRWDQCGRLQSSACVPTCGGVDDDQELVWDICLYALGDIQLLPNVLGPCGQRHSVQFAWPASP